jgi:hypothetical protein
VGLVVQVQGIGDQLLDVDFRRAFEAASIAATPVVTSIASATLTAAIRASALRAFSAGRSAATLATLALRGLTALSAWSLGRTIGLRFALRPIRLRRFAFGRFDFGARRFGFGSAWFLLCLLRISHPNLCIVR